MPAPASPVPPKKSGPPSPSAGDDRRGFVGKATAVVIGGLITVFPFLAGFRVLADPLRSGRSSGRGVFVRIAALDAVPEDGTPREFPVIADRHDAWNYYPPGPIGAVYLRRKGAGSKEIEAFNVRCPHLGCFVGFDARRDVFQCPCHTSAFALDGAVISGPSPRALDVLDCEKRGEEGSQEVWVKFVNYRTGLTEKVEKT